jgi:hypothetical protein
MNNKLNLKERLKRNWLTMIFALAFLITLLNYFELKTENSRLKRRFNSFENNIDMINQENSNLENENEDLENENEDLRVQNEDE